MRRGFLASVSLLLSGAGLALAQAPVTSPPAAPPAPPAAAPAADGADGAGERFDGPPLPAPGRAYFGADYLFWFTRPTKLPPLLLQGSSINPGAVPALGSPDTTVLIG